MIIFKRSIFSKLSFVNHSRCTSIFFSSLESSKAEFPYFECSSPSALDIALSGFKLIEDFVSEKEETSLVTDVEPKWRRLKYQQGHWDNAIQGYRETENVRWSPENSLLISNMRSTAFSDDDVQKSLVHVLDLSPSGCIMPHVDSVKFCGRVICGLSLLSPCVMKFVKTDDSNVWFKALLNRRSLYIMSDSVRYDFTHQVLENSESHFCGKHIDKGRRISILCRSEPDSSQFVESDNNIFNSKVIPLE